MLYWWGEGMEEMEKIITCKDTRAQTTHRVMNADLNEHATMFGGRLLAIVDAEASLPAVRLARSIVVTASMDHVQFLTPFKMGTTVEMTAFVTGIGRRSIEVFAKIIGEEVTTGHRFLGFTCFLTYVAEDQTIDLTGWHLQGETEEEQVLVAGYPARRQARKAARAEQTVLNRQLALD